MMIFSKKKNSKSTRTSGDSSLFVLAKTTTATRAVTALRDDEYLSSSLFFAHRWFMVCVHTLYNLREKILEEECVSRRKRRLFSIASRSQKISLFSLLKFFGLCPFSPKKKLSLSQKQESGVLLLSLIVSSLLSLSEENKSNLFTFILSRPARVSRSFIKECLYIRRTLLSLLYYSYQGTEERERAESANTLSL